MFRDDHQRAAVCKSLCARVRLESLWTPTGPSSRAEDLLHTGGRPLSHGEKVMLFIAWAIWNGEGNVTLNEVLNTLDRRNLEAVGGLLGALADGPMLSTHGLRSNPGL